MLCLQGLGLFGISKHCGLANVVINFFEQADNIGVIYLLRF